MRVPPRRSPVLLKTCYDNAMRFKTHISKTQNGELSIRGYTIHNLIKKHSFAEVVFLLIRGDLPSEEECSLLEAIFVAGAEGGIAPPSAFVSRISTSVGNDMHVALAAGILSTGKRHGGAVEDAAALFEDTRRNAQDIVKSFQAEKKNIPGFGHKAYKNEDVRATALYEKSLSIASTGPFARAYEIEKELERVKGKKLPLNIDGAIAAAILTLGFPAKAGNVFFILPRIAGMAAHILEEQEQNVFYRRLDATDIEET